MQTTARVNVRPLEFCRPAPCEKIKIKNVLRCNYVTKQVLMCIIAIYSKDILAFSRLLCYSLSEAA
jgi:hypothetical protein